MIQCSLFAPVHASQRPQSQPVVSARTIVKRVASLESAIASRFDSLEGVAANVVMVKAHIEQSRRGKIDLNWYEGAMRDGLFDAEWCGLCRSGNYPRKLRSVLRNWHNVLHFEALSLRQDIAALRVELAPLKQIVQRTLQ
jgi:hypothetical protein